MAKRRVGVKRLGTGSWQARVQVPDGDGGRKQVSRNFATVTDAVRWREEARTDVSRGSWRDPDAGAITVSQFAREWLDTQPVEATTLESMRNRFRVHVLPQLGNYQLRQLKPSILTRWLRGLEDHLAPRTVQVIHGNLSSMLSAAVEDDVIPSNPAKAKSVQPRKGGGQRLEVWSSDTVAAVIAALPGPYRGLAALGAGCGLRQGEAFGLRVADVHFLERTIDVVQQVRIEASRPTVAAPKGRKTRHGIPLPAMTAQAVSERIRVFQPSDLVHVSREGKPLNRNYFNTYVWKPALVAAGVEPNRSNGFHALRHHYASVLLHEGVSVPAVARYLGHADPGFTLRVYGHLMPASEDKARQALDRAFGAQTVAV